MNTNQTVHAVAGNSRKKLLIIVIFAVATGGLALWLLASVAWKQGGGSGFQVHGNGRGNAQVQPKPAIPFLSRPPLLSELTALAQWSAEAKFSDISAPQALLLWISFAEDEAVGEILASRLPKETMPEVAKLIWRINPSRNAARFLYRFAKGSPESAVQLCQLESFQRHPAFPLFLAAAFREYGDRFPDAATDLAIKLPQRYRATALAALAGVIAESSPALAQQAFDAWLASASGSLIASSDAAFSKAFAVQILEAARSRRLPRQTTLDALSYFSTSNPLEACKWAADTLPAYDPDFLSNLEGGLYDTSDTKALEAILDSQAQGMREPLRGRVVIAAVGSLARKAPQAASVRLEALPDSPLKDAAAESFAQQCTAAAPRDLAAFLSEAKNSSPSVVSKVFTNFAQSSPYRALDLLPLLSPEHQAELRGAIQVKWGSDSVGWLKANGYNISPSLEAK